MAFAAATKQSIVDALNLHRDLSRDNSLLDSLMTVVETDFPSYVTKIESALTSIGTLDTSIAAQKDGDLVRVVRIEDYSSKEYFSAGGPTAHLRGDRARHIANIKAWLDPERRLVPYEMDGRVIETL